MNQKDIDNKAIEISKATGDWNIAKSQLITFAKQDREYRISASAQAWSFQEMINKSLAKTGLKNPEIVGAASIISKIID